MIRRSILLLVILSACRIWAQSLSSNSVHTLAYGPHPRQVLDIWPADTDTPSPVALYAHGGGFHAGDKSAVQRMSLIRLLHADGITIASMNYRFIEHAPLADILREGSRAVQFLRAEAQTWNLDPGRIAMIGTSAGAGIALWTAFQEDMADPSHQNPVRHHSSRLQCAVAINPQAGFDPLTWIRVMGLPPNGVLPSFRKYLDGYPQTLDALLLNPNVPTLSLLDLISADDPPVFLMNTYRDRAPRNTGDYQHHPNHVHALAARCRERGLLHSVSLREDEDHHASRIRAFLREHLLSAP